MRATFSSVMRKRSFTLMFDRSSEVTWEIVEKLQDAARHSGVVLCTSATVKSLQLKLLERMHTLGDATAKHTPSMELDICALVHVMQLFKSGCVLMDEVDLFLHPLKSELNFPLGAKKPIEPAPERWQCAIHALDAIFTHDGSPMSVPFQDSGRALEVLTRLRGVIKMGLRPEVKALQNVPHLVLLSVDWYHEHMKPVMAEWMELWISRQHVLSLQRETIMEFITADWASSRWASTARPRSSRRATRRRRRSGDCTRAHAREGH